MSKLFTKDILYHFIAACVIFTVMKLVNTLPWHWPEIIVATLILFIREMTQASLWVTAKWLPDEGREGEIKITKGFELGRGWHSLPGGMFTVHRTAEWAMPILMLLFITGLAL